MLAILRVRCLPVVPSVFVLILAIAAVKMRGRLARAESLNWETLQSVVLSQDSGQWIQAGNWLKSLLLLWVSLLQESGPVHDDRTVLAMPGVGVPRIATFAVAMLAMAVPVLVGLVRSQPDLPSNWPKARSPKRSNKLSDES